MSDTLLINDRKDLSGTEDSDYGTISILKNKTRKRKGRGFEYEIHTVLHNDHDSEDSQNNIDIENGPDDSSKESCIPLKSVEGWILFVTNLHEEATEDDVETLFSSFGTICNCRLNLDRRTGFSKGYVIIEYKNYAEAELARLECDGADVLGKTISVNWCFVKVPKKKFHIRRIF